MIDFADPYTILCGESDITFCNDWQSFTYDVKDLDGRIIEADPEKCETFIALPGNDAVNFDHYMNLHDQNLNQIKAQVGESIWEMLTGMYWGDGEHVSREMDAESEEWIDYHIKQKGKEFMDDIMDASAFYMYVWLIGPLARQFRQQNHLIFNECYNNGSCFMYEGQIIDPMDYKRIERPPQSCAICGLDAWCVEMVHVNGTTRRICEHHLNGDMPKYGYANCGMKVCKYVSCHHHEDHGNRGPERPVESRHHLLPDQHILLQLQNNLNLECHQLLYFQLLLRQLHQELCQLL